MLARLGLMIAIGAMMAAAVLDWKAISGKSDHRYICTGSTVAASVKPCGMSTMKATMPIISSGAVSPKARARPRMVPVKIPGTASGSTWWNTACWCEAPTPRAASLIDGGTAIVARLFILTSPQLMRIGWFARLHDRIMPWKHALYEQIRVSWAWRYGRMLKSRVKQMARRAWTHGRPVVARLLALAQFQLRSLFRRA